MEFVFEVKRNSPYKELTIIAGNVTVSSGLLDEQESIEMAKELISAAEELLPEEMNDIENKLYKIRESL